ncbi:plasmid stabilization protein [Fibrobacterales bacterium]|nr:plasmid stabilization protein [Fibrobacterales bacterium]
MQYRIQIAEKAIKYLNKVPEPYISTIKSKIDGLINFSGSMPNIKALQGEFKGFYRLRVGDYRVLFEVINETIIVIDVFPRGNGY